LELQPIYFLLLQGTPHVDDELKESSVLVSKDDKVKSRRRKAIIIDSESEEECTEQQLTNYMIEGESLDPEFIKKRNVLRIQLPLDLEWLN
jgi:hypothetical protein